MIDPAALTPLTIRHWNKVGFMTLVHKEVARFMAVYTQTLVAPVVTMLMYYTVFALAFGGLERTVGNVPYLQFLAPGLMMMTMVQNAFSNTSSSIVIGKVQGNITDILMPPLSPLELYLGFMIGAVMRGLMIGVCAGIAIALFVPMQITSVLQIAAFAVLGTMMLASLGIAGGLWSDKFDHIAAVTNFVVMPLTFLSGTFYSIKQLPAFWQDLTHFNPFFYMIDGFRAGFIGHADGPVWIGFITLVVVNILLAMLCYWMLRTGYKIKS